MICKKNKKKYLSTPKDLYQRLRGKKILKKTFGFKIKLTFGGYFEGIEIYISIG